MKTISVFRTTHSIIVDDEDYEKVFLAGPWTYNKRDRCAKNKFSQRVHQFILQVKDELEVDHINRDQLDNRRSNLRLVTHVQNLMNRGVARNNTTGYKGVWFNGKGGYSAGIGFNGKDIHLGTFDDIHEAARVYNEAALRLHGETAFLNVIVAK